MPTPTFATIEIAMLGDDLTWTVRCDLASLVLFFENPDIWLAALNNDPVAVNQRAAIGNVPLTIQRNLTVRLKPVQSNVTTAVAAARSGSDGGGASFLLPPSSTVASPLNGGGAAAVAPMDQLAMISGLSGTGYISIEPSVQLTTAAFQTNPTWNAYWTDWLDPTKTPAVMTVNEAEHRFSFHLDLTQPNDPKRGEKMAAFIVGASHSTARLTQLFARSRTHTPNTFDAAPPQLGTFDAAALAAMTFLYITDLSQSRKACEVIVGPLTPTVPPSGQGGTFVPTDSTTKDYA